MKIITTPPSTIKVSGGVVACNNTRNLHILPIYASYNNGVSGVSSVLAAVLTVRFFISERT